VREVSVVRGVEGSKGSEGNGVSEAIFGLFFDNFRTNYGLFRIMSYYFG
jgi:hypothetical protein